MFLSPALCRNELPPIPPQTSNLCKSTRGPRYGSLLRFIAIWSELMGVLGACSACARTLSACLDDMAGGKVRILILGREALPQVSVKAQTLQTYMFIYKFIDLTLKMYFHCDTSTLIVRSIFILLIIKL